MSRICRSPQSPARSREIVCMARFACVGSTGVAVNFILLWFLVERLHLHYVVSSALATEAAILSNFSLNHVWTFATVHDGQSLAVKVLKFNVISAGGLALTVTTLFVLTHFLGVYYLLANGFAVGSGAIWNYRANRLWTWRIGYDSASAGASS